MRRFSFASSCALLIAAAACGSNTSSDPGGNGGEIRNEEDVRQIFEALMPDLVDALTEVADQQFSVKGGGASIMCPGGGSIRVDATTGRTILTQCSVGGIIVSGTVVLSVQRTGASSYEASFTGPLTIAGTYTGMLEVVSSIITWSVPVTIDNIYWDIMVRIGEQVLSASSEDSRNGGSGGTGGNGTGGTGGGGQCPQLCAGGTFALNPGTARCSTITRQVCFHSKSDLGGCDVFNYCIPGGCIPPGTDFSEFMDIFYGGEDPGCVDEMLAEFNWADDGHFRFFGTPRVAPPQCPPSDPLLIASGSYSTSLGDSGEFGLYWPMLSEPQACEALSSFFP